MLPKLDLGTPCPKSREAYGKKTGEDLMFGRRFSIVALGLAATLALGTAWAEDPPKAPEEEKGVFEKLGDDIVEGATALKDQAAAAVPDVPSGAVVAFNRDKCPLGWSSFLPAAGRVVRGVGDSGDGQTIGPMQIGEQQEADSGSDVKVGVPWVGLLMCEKD